MPLQPSAFTCNQFTISNHTRHQLSPNQTLFAITTLCIHFQPIYNIKPYKTPTGFLSVTLCHYNLVHSLVGNLPYQTIQNTNCLLIRHTLQLHPREFTCNQFSISNYTRHKLSLNQTTIQDTNCLPIIHCLPLQPSAFTSSHSLPLQPSAFNCNQFTITT